MDYLSLQTVRDITRHLNKQAKVCGAEESLRTYHVIEILNRAGWCCQRCSAPNRTTARLKGRHIWHAGIWGNRPDNIRVFCPTCDKALDSFSRSRRRNRAPRTSLGMIPVSA